VQKLDFKCSTTASGGQRIPYSQSIRERVRLQQIILKRAIHIDSPPLTWLANLACLSSKSAGGRHGNSLVHTKYSFSVLIFTPMPIGVPVFQPSSPYSTAFVDCYSAMWELLSNCLSSSVRAVEKLQDILSLSKNGHASNIKDTIFQQCHDLADIAHHDHTWLAYSDRAERHTRTKTIYSQYGEYPSSRLLIYSRVVRFK
jgi:hypothetical protein